MSTTFIKDPREVAKPGDIVKVKVMDVDKARKRIALSMRMDDQPGQQGGKRQGAPADRNTRRDMDRINAGTRGGNGGGGSGGNAFADAFAKAGLRGR